MKFTLFPLLILLAILVALAGCSKENRIEKNLWKNGGVWDIEYYVQSDDNFSNAYVDCGIFTFDEGGTGSYMLNIGGGTQYQPFQYQVVGNKLKLTYGETNDDYIISWEKGVMKISIVGQIFSLRKRD